MWVETMSLFTVIAVVALVILTVAFAAIVINGRSSWVNSIRDDFEPGSDGQ